MAFSIRNLSVLAYAQGFTLWHYTSGVDTLPVVGGDGFFDGASDLLTGGDMLLISAPDGGRVSLVRPISKAAAKGAGARGGVGRKEAGKTMAMVPLS